MRNSLIQKSKNNINILITNVGRRAYFIDFLKDIKISNVKINIFCADNNIYSRGMNITGKNIKNILTPKISQGSNNYLNKIKNLVKKYHINLIIPLTDYDIILLSRNKKKIKNLFNCDVLVSDLWFVKSCMNKILFSEFCNKNNLTSPKIISKKQINKIKLPVIKKLINGSGSKDLEIINSKSSLKKINFKKDFLQKFIIGQEYHMDILNDFNGKFVACCVKKKLLMWNGETDQAETVENKTIEKLAKNISKITKHVGNLDCDLILDEENKIHLIDFNPRFGGGYPFTHLSGMKFIDILIKKKLNIKYNIPKRPQKKIFVKGISLHKLNKNNRINKK